MTLEEFCTKYGYSENTVKKKWSDVQKSIQKKTGVTVDKEGRGQNMRFIERVPADNRALTIFKEGKESAIIDSSVISFENLEFKCLLSIVVTPMMVFRGSYLDFCRYNLIDVKNVEKVKIAMHNLQDRGAIFIYEDKTVDRELVTITLVGRIEDEYKLDISLIRTCKQLADEYHKQDWIPLLKTWAGMQKLSEDQPFTMADFEKITGLSAYQIRENKKILERNNIFKTSRAYSSFQKCIGQFVDLNAFVPGN